MVLSLQKNIVSGRVQGVAYRKWLVNKCLAMGDVYGYAKNLSNGDVEVLILGSKEDINRVTILCAKGPIFAKVQDVISEIVDIKDYPEVEEGNFKRL